MKYWFDTEFIERGNQHPLTLISIGIVAEDGREFYAETMQGADYHYADCSPWVQDNVLPHLQLQELDPCEPWLVTGQRMWMMLGHPGAIAAGILEFVGDDSHPEFWAYYADYDWVILCQLFGTMMDLPEGWPMFGRDIKQLAGDDALPANDGVEHHALADARWNRTAHLALAAA